MCLQQAPKITYVTLFADESIHPKVRSGDKEARDKALGKHYKMDIGNEAVSRRREFAVTEPDRHLDRRRLLPDREQEARQGGTMAAKQAFPPWSRTPWQERVRILMRAAELMDERKFEIAAAITLRGGEEPDRGARRGVGGAWTP